MADLVVYVFGSGSKGNCVAVQNTLNGSAVLIDCGLTFKALESRSAELGFDLACIDSVLVTHEHHDHTRGIGVMLRALAKRGVTPALYCNEATFFASPELTELGEADKHDVRMFDMDGDLSCAGMDVHPFPTSHDAACPCGFRLDTQDDAVGFMTDTGMITAAAHEALMGVRLLAIEANHDIDLLKHTSYPLYVQRRIAGERGHLSNAQSAAGLETLLSDTLEQVVCMHVSKKSNTYDLPGKALDDVLARYRHHANVQVAHQDRPLTVS